MPAWKSFLLVVGLLFVPLSTYGQESVVPPEPIRGFSFHITGWGEALLADQENEVTYGGRLLVDGPLANPWQHPLRLRIDLKLSATPGRDLNFTDLTTFGRTATANFGTTFHLSALDVGDQHISTSLYSGIGFTTALEDSLLEEFLRRFELGFEFRVDAADFEPAFFRISYCRDKVAGYIGLGQLCLAGELPVANARGVSVLFGGEALLNMSKAVTTPQRDLLRFYVGLSN
jgi:hypothetical protein